MTAPTTNTPPSNAHLRTRLCACGWRTTCDTARTDATCACCGDPLPATTATTTGGAR
jgi:hypothetical protein